MISRHFRAPILMIVAFVITCGVILALFLTRTPTERAIPEPPVTATFPEPTQNVGSTSDPDAPPTVATRSGRLVTIPDLLEGSDVELVDETGGVYEIAGERGFDTPIYRIFYYQSSATIRVSLLTEDLLFARDRAEAELKDRLGIANTIEFCSYDISVIVPQSVSEEYSGRDLGFPPCPGAESLVLEQ